MVFMVEGIFAETKIYSFVTFAYALDFLTDGRRMMC